MEFVLIEDLLVNINYLEAVSPGRIYLVKYTTEHIDVPDLTVPKIIDLFKLLNGITSSETNIDSIKYLAKNFVYFPSEYSNAMIINKHHIVCIGSQYVDDIAAYIQCTHQIGTCFAYISSWSPQMCRAYLSSLSKYHTHKIQILLPINKTHVLFDLVNPSKETREALAKEDISRCSLLLSRYTDPSRILSCSLLKYSETNATFHVWTCDCDIIIWDIEKEYNQTIVCGNVKYGSKCQAKSSDAPWIESRAGDFIIIYYKN